MTLIGSDRQNAQRNLQTLKKIELSFCSNDGSYNLNGEVTIWIFSNFFRPEQEKKFSGKYLVEMVSLTWHEVLLILFAVGKEMKIDVCWFFSTLIAIRRAFKGIICP